MKKTSRRSLLKAAAAGSVAATGLGAVLGSHRVSAARDTPLDRRNEKAQEHSGHGRRLSGRRASATISFGEWGISAAGPGLPGPLDRFPAASPNNRNVHLLLPNEVDIEAGGSVNFIISGFHLVLVYDDGTEMGDINSTLITEGSTPPGLIDDQNRRIYRGLDPRALLYEPAPGTTVNLGVRDRVEVVQFPVPGRYFVTCGVLPHFLEGMNGYVNVRESGRD